MGKFSVRTGRMGYSREFGPNTGGIKTETFNPLMPKRPSLQEIIAPIVKELIAEGRDDDAFDVIVGQPFTPEYQEYLCSYFFPWLL